MRLLVCAFVCVLSVVAVGGAISAAEWATLKGKFVYDGTPPAPKELPCNEVINKDTQTCCKIKHFDESLVVGKDGGVANIAVYLRSKAKNVNPDALKAAQQQKVKIDNHYCRFEPRMVGVVEGGTLTVGNSDNIGHNSNIIKLGENPQLSPVSARDFKVAKGKSGAIPGEVVCNIHPWMKGWVVIRPDPYFAVTNDDGSFEIKDLPVGEDLEYQVWHEKSGFVTTVSLDGKKTTWDKGRFKKKLAKGETDLGEIKVDAKNFKK
jgi:plastocyanin